jgi:molybdopterin biosynthesis enzyme
MDGYAMRTADVPADGTVLPVSQRIAAAKWANRCSRAARRAFSPA